LHGIVVGRRPDGGAHRVTEPAGSAPASFIQLRESVTMARYDDAYDSRHRSVLPGGPHARAKLAGPPLGYGYPSDEDEIARGYYTGGGAYREVTDRPYLAERGLLRRSDFRRLGRRGRDWDRDPRGEVGGPYVGEYRARLERERYGRTLSPPEHYRGGWDTLSAYRDPDDPWCGYRFLFSGYQGRRSDRGVGGPGWRRRRRRR